MPLSFTGLDWVVVASYVLALALAGWLASRRAIKTADGYFLASHHIPTWLVVISVLSTTQSAATFLGVPDYAYRGDYAYLATNISALIAAIIVASTLMPRFLAIGVTTVYELLEQRFGTAARRAAAAMYLMGRILASGARLYLAAIAVSMIIFLDIAPEHIAISAVLLLVFGLAFTLWGGLNAVVWSDCVQVVLYVGAALIVLFWLWSSLPLTTGEMIDALRDAPNGTNKLQLLDTSLDFSHPFSLAAIFTGLVLLNIGNFGLDQDTSQRFLSCEDAGQARRALILSAIGAVPVVLIFLIIGSLLYLHYSLPDSGGVTGSFAGEKVTVFMTYILSEIPPGLRGLFTAGVIAAAAVNSGLISMSAVAVSDFYRPWKEARGGAGEGHYVTIGRVMVVLLGLCLLATAILCYWWQRYADTPLLEFVLGVMGFAYSGLLGVYATAIFTRRGSATSVIAALATGFLVTLFLQPYVIDALGLPVAWNGLAFPWQLCIGTTAAFLVCISTSSGLAQPREAS